MGELALRGRRFHDDHYPTETQMKKLTQGNLRDPVEKQAIETVLRGLAQRQEPDRQKWVTMLATTAISVLHGTYGRRFTEGYLNAARLSLDNPSESAPIEVVEVPETKQ